MTHDDPRLYLVSHASLAKRGLSIGQANVYHMLTPEHRLYIPFSLLQILVDLNGKELPRMPCAHTRSESLPSPTLQEIANHLNALTTASLPLALAHSCPRVPASVGTLGRASVCSLVPAYRT